MAVPLDATRVQIIPAGSAQIPRAERLMGAFLAGYQRSTRDNYRYSLVSWLAFCNELGLEPVTEVRRSHIEAWARVLEERRGNQPATVSIRLSAVRSWYTWLERDEKIEKNPGRFVAMPKVSDESTTVGLSRRHFDAIYEEAHRKASYLALVSLLAFNALRVSEALGTNIEGLRQVRGHYLLKVKAKGGGITEEPLAPPTWFAVDQAIAGRGSGPIILGATGNRMSRSGAYKAIRRMGVAANVPFNVHPHQFRHSGITASLDAGRDVRDTQTFARHKKSDTTIRYDRNRARLDRHPTYQVAAWLLS